MLHSVALHVLPELLVEQPTQPVMIVTRTEPPLRKGCPLKDRGVVKVESRNGFIGADYASVVENQRAREGKTVYRTRGQQIGLHLPFKPSRLWEGMGEHVPGNRHLVRHRATNEHYLVFYPKQDAKGVVQAIWTRYEALDTCETIAAEEVTPWLAKFRGGVRLEGSARQGVSKRIAWRLILLENILRMRVRGSLVAIV